MTGRVPRLGRRGFLAATGGVGLYAGGALGSVDADSELAGDVHLVVRIGDETYETLARHAGADEVIVPEVVSGEQVTTTL